MSSKGKKEWMEKTIPINLLPSRTKEQYLKNAQEKITEFANILIPYSLLKKYSFIIFLEEIKS